MSLTALRDAFQNHAEDIKLNLDALAAETILSEQQKWGCFLACAYAAGEPAVIGAIEQEAGARLSLEATIAVKKAVAIMAMNTVYYRAINLLQNHDYRAEPPNLSMAALSNPGVDKIDFELWAFAISAVNGCGSCLNAHETELHKRGVSVQRVQAALRIAAVVNAASAVLRAETAAVG